MAPRRLAAVLAAALTTVALPAYSAQHELGLNTHQSTGVGLDATRDAGLRWVRIDFNWLDAEPAQGSFNWALFDTIVDGAKARGLSVLAVIGYGPSWASAGDAKGDGTLNDVPVQGAYAAFATAVVQHFQGRITHYELWNEPNLEVFFEGTPNDYVQRVLIPGADAVHAACPTCKVVAPGLASVGGQYDVWMDAALGAAKDKIDIVSGHVYAGFPEGGTGTTSDSFFNKLESHRVLKVGDAVVYEGPLSYREIMMKHGVNKPFWLTETGLEASLGDAAELEAQRTFYRHVLEAALTRPWWQNTIFYEAFDEPSSGYEWGVVVHDAAAPKGYKEKPVFSLLQKVASAQKVFGGDGHDCSDGLDNEGDGVVDYPAEVDCDSAFGDSEGLPPPDAGTGGGGGGGGGGAGGTAPSAGSGGAGGTSGTGGAGGKTEESGDCGCVVAGGDGGSPTAALALAAALVVLRGRRGARWSSFWWRPSGGYRRGTRLVAA